MKEFYISETAYSKQKVNAIEYQIGSEDNKSCCRFFAIKECKHRQRETECSLKKELEQTVPPPGPGAGLFAEASADVGDGGVDLFDEQEEVRVFR